MKKECEHKWVKLYFRKKFENKDFQTWIPLSNKYICQNCLLINTVTYNNIKEVKTTWHR